MQPGKPEKSREEVVRLKILKDRVRLEEYKSDVGNWIPIALETKRDKEIETFFVNKTKEDISKSIRRVAKAKKRQRELD